MKVFLWLLAVAALTGAVMTTKSAVDLSGHRGGMTIVSGGRMARVSSNQMSFLNASPQGRRYLVGVKRTEERMSQSRNTMIMFALLLWGTTAFLGWAAVRYKPRERTS
jgi:hypothetical protein